MKEEDDVELNEEEEEEESAEDEDDRKPSDAEMRNAREFATRSSRRAVGRSRRPGGIGVRGVSNEEKELDEEAKPDYIDLDKDGDKEEPMKKAAQDAKKKKMDEARMREIIAYALKNNAGS